MDFEFISTNDELLLEGKGERWYKMIFEFRIFTEEIEYLV